ncbi:hypothetical protein LEP1GSC058_1140 [Leptospira fainei serovar Hurstbridge str. BUT 6]|uniref:Uncharacterized protein n=1 Tax=Leptospira fainei serovar Hurstbridge str. BUT 6 TaxID=1193011 RepID=S3V841_9LEPT|nr:hypothetical protein LEP1GSC058_1140 [Leptospira fainei serovar Hurstbridge str. BUT 6]
MELPYFTKSASSQEFFEPSDLRELQQRKNRLDEKCKREERIYCDESGS